MNASTKSVNEDDSYILKTTKDGSVVLNLESGNYERLNDAYLEECKKNFKHKFLQKIPSPPFVGSNYEWIRTVGLGKFSRILLIREKRSGDYFVVKVLGKETVVERNMLSPMKNEKQLFQALSHPFIVTLTGTFKDNNYIYFMFPYIPGGEVFRLLREVGNLEEVTVRFYTAQLVLALEYLHFIGVVYRDLKPENLLIDVTGYLKIIDMGYAKCIQGRTYTLVGTPEYLPPEIILHTGYGFGVDWWTFGVLTYEMASGISPFYDPVQTKMFDRIVQARYTMPAYFSKDLSNLISNLLQTDISKRIGMLSQGVRDIKQHKFYRTTQWVSVLTKTAKPPLIPLIRGPGDTAYYDKHKEDLWMTSSTNQFVEEFADF